MFPPKCGINNTSYKTKEARQKIEVPDNSITIITDVKKKNKNMKKQKNNKNRKEYTKEKILFLR